MHLASRTVDVVIGGTLPNDFSSSTGQALQVVSTTEAQYKPGFVGTAPNKQAFVQVSGARRKSCEVSPPGVSSWRLRGPERPHALRPNSIEAFLVGVMEYSRNSRCQINNILGQSAVVMVFCERVECLCSFVRVMCRPNPVGSITRVVVLAEAKTGQRSLLRWAQSSVACYQQPLRGDVAERQQPCVIGITGLCCIRLKCMLHNGLW